MFNGDGSRVSGGPSIGCFILALLFLILAVVAFFALPDLPNILIKLGLKALVFLLWITGP